MLGERIVVGPGHPVYLVVHRVDHRLQLRVRRGRDRSELVFQSVKGHPMPTRFPLQLRRWYFPLFDNNDGGAGALKLSVVQQVGRMEVSCGYEVDISGIHGPTSPPFAPFILQEG